jgi:hypothetical protein
VTLSPTEVADQAREARYGAIAVQDVNDVTADDFGLHLWPQEGGVVTPKSLGTSLWAG